MLLENSDRIGLQFVLPDEIFAPAPVVVSASRRTELVGLKPGWLTRALQRFPNRYKKEIHSVVLWTKDFRNIYERQDLKRELSNHNILVQFTMTGLGGTRIEPTVPEASQLIQAVPKLLDYLGDTRRLRWRFDPIVTLRKDDGKDWSSVRYFRKLAQTMSRFGVDNCYFSFAQIYPRKFAKRQLDEAGINMVVPYQREKLNVVNYMREIANEYGITLYACAQRDLEGMEGIVAAKCIDAELLTQLHPRKLLASSERDDVQAKFRLACYCTKSIDIGGYFPCGHGCVYCYAEAAVPVVSKLKMYDLPSATRG